MEAKLVIPIKYKNTSVTGLLGSSTLGSNHLTKLIWPFPVQPPLISAALSLTSCLPASPNTLTSIHCTTVQVVTFNKNMLFIKAASYNNKLMWDLLKITPFLFMIYCISKEHDFAEKLKWLWTLNFFNSLSWNNYSNVCREMNTVLNKWPNNCILVITQI